MIEQDSVGSEGTTGSVFALPLKASRAVFGFLFFVLSIGYSAIAYLELDLGSYSAPGPAMFPLVVGPLLTIAGLMVAFERIDPEWGTTYTIPAGRDGRKLGLLLAVIATYIALLPVLGNLIGSALLAFSVMCLLSSKPRPLRYALYAVAMAVLCHVVFVNLLQVRMPRGIVFSF